MSPTAFVVVVPLCRGADRCFDPHRRGRGDRAPQLTTTGAEERQLAKLPVLSIAPPMTARGASRLDSKVII